MNDKYLQIPPLHRLHCDSNRGPSAFCSATLTTWPPRIVVVLETVLYRISTVIATVLLFETLRSQIDQYYIVHYKPDHRGHKVDI